jgi:hypothetical protein
MRLPRAVLMASAMVISMGICDAGVSGCGPQRPAKSQDPHGCKNALGEISSRGVRGVVLPSAVARRALLLRRKDVEDYWYPSEDDVLAVETGLRNALHERLADEYKATPSAQRDANVEALNHVLSNLDKYLRQYAGIVVGGSRRVLVNAFPNDAYCWRDEYVAIDDGGAWFWTMQYDVKLHQYLHWELAAKR